MKILLQFLGEKESGPVFSYELAKGLINNHNIVYAILSENVENKDDWITLLGNDKIVYMKSMLNRKRPITSSIAVIKDLLNARKRYGKIAFDCAIRTFPWKYDDYYSSILHCGKIINYLHDPIPHSGVNQKDADLSKAQSNRADYLIVMTERFVPVVQEVFNRRREEIIISRHGLLSYNRNTINSPQYDENEEFHFVFFGRIDPYKGIDVLSEAYKILINKHLNARLTIAGAGELRDYVLPIKNFEKVMIINRYLTDDEVDELFNGKNIILVIPYKDATQSGVMSVAYNYMIPIIATNTGGLCEQLFNGKVGILVQSNSVVSLADAMERIVKNPHIYSQQVQLMKEYRKELNWNTIASKLCGDIANLILK